MKTRTCEKCGSRDVYELRFEKEVFETPMNFKGIKTVNREEHKDYEKKASLEKMEMKKEC
jgi:hypothetical protein